MKIAKIAIAAALAATGFFAIAAAVQPAGGMPYNGVSAAGMPYNGISAQPATGMPYN